MSPGFLRNCLKNIYRWMLPVLFLLTGCSGGLQKAGAVPQTIQIVPLFQFLTDKNAVNPAQEEVLNQKSIDLTQIQGDMNWWKEIAINQNNLSSRNAALTTFQAHGISVTENDLSGTCAESAVAMNINYLNRFYGVGPVNVEDVIRMAGAKNLIYADGGVSIEGQSVLAKSYGYRVYGRDAKVIGYEGYALTFADIQTFTGLGYPVNVSLRITSSGLNTNNDDVVNHALLVLKTDPLFQTVTYISSAQAGLASVENSAITPQQVSYDTFKKAWRIGQNDIGLGFVMYR